MDLTTSFWKDDSELLSGSLFEDIFERKRMVGVYIKLVGYVITAWEATNKANAIISENFDSSADKRLELLQLKAIKAKSQLKTVVFDPREKYAHCCRMLLK